MARNFLINLFFLIPVWLINLTTSFNKDVKRNTIFDPQSKFFLSLMPKFDLHLIEDKDIPKIRKEIHKKRKNLRLSKKTKRKIKTIDHLIDENNSLLLREYVPYKTDNANIILFFHGGGYVLNSVGTHHDMISYFSEKLRTRIYSLEYSLSPENKFPKARDESLLALRWLMEQGHDSVNVSLCGDSAGAHLAASLSRHIAVDKNIKLHSQFLIYPMCNPDCNSESHKTFSQEYLLTNSAMKWFWEKLSSGKSDMKDKTFNLMLNDTTIEVPKTVIVTAGFDPLVDEAEKFAFLLYENDNDVTQLHYPSLFHGFASMTRLKSAKMAVDDFLKEYKEIL